MNGLGSQVTYIEVTKNTLNLPVTPHHEVATIESLELVTH